MAASSGVTLGYGTVARIGRFLAGSTTPTFYTIKGTEQLMFPDQTPEDVDVTSLTSPDRTEETIPGLKRVGTLTLPVQYAPGLATDTLLSELDEFDADGLKEDVIFEIGRSGGTKRQWYAYVNSWRPTDINAKGKMMAELILKVKASIDPPMTGTDGDTPPGGG